MSALLCLRVRQAYLSETASAKLKTYVVIKFDYVKTSTVVATGHAPLWEQDFIFEVTSESDCVAFELWSKAHDEAAEQMIGALCIPLDLITRIDQSGMITGSGGYGDWYPFDAEFVIHTGCIAGTRGQTGHSLLLDAYIEEPTGYSADDVAAYYYNCGLVPDNANGSAQFALSTNAIQQQYHDLNSCESNYLNNELSASCRTGHHNDGHDMNYGPYDYDYEGYAFSSAMAAYGSSSDHVPGQDGWAPYPYQMESYSGVNGGQYFAEQWDYSTQQVSEHFYSHEEAAMHLDSHVANGEQHYYQRREVAAMELNSSQAVPDEWTYYAAQAERLMQLQQQDSGNLAPEAKSTTHLVGHENIDAPLPSSLLYDNYSDLPVLDLTAGTGSEKGPHQIAEATNLSEHQQQRYSQNSDEILSLVDKESHQLLNGRAFLPSSPSATEPHYQSESPQTGMLLSNTVLSASSNSAMIRRLPILPGFGSKARTPTPPSVEEQVQQQINNNNFSNVTTIQNQVQHNIPSLLTNEYSADTESWMQHDAVLPATVNVPVPEFTPEPPAPQPMAYTNETFEHDNFAVAALAPDLSTQINHQVNQQVVAAPEMTMSQPQPQPHPYLPHQQSIVRSSIGSSSPKVLSASPSQQLLHTVLSPKTSDNYAVDTVNARPSVSPSPSQRLQPSYQNSPVPSRPTSKSASLEPVNQLSTMDMQQQQRSRSPSNSSQIARGITPQQSRSPSIGMSPSPSITATKPQTIAKVDVVPPTGVLSPSPSVDRFKNVTPPTPPEAEHYDHEDKPVEMEQKTDDEYDEEREEFDENEEEMIPVRPKVEAARERSRQISMDSVSEERAKTRWLQAFDHVRDQISPDEDNLLSEETDTMPDMPGANDRNRTDFYNQINTSSDLKPKATKMSHVSELTVAASKRKAEAQTAVITSRALNDEELKLHVYKKTLQALLYPMSKTSGDHKFEFFSAKHPTYCFECEGLLWGIARQGLRCTQCGVKCHDRCKALMNADCLQRAAEKSARQGAHDRAQVFMNIITDLMKKREVEKKETFELIRKIFKVDEKNHQGAIDQSKQAMLDGASKWSANISVTVVSAQGLMGKDATGTSDPYVTIQLGRTKRRTKTKMKTLNPEWNEKFFFECHNISERIKIRVWDEDDDFKSRLRQKFTRESDDFLGQYIIDVAKLCGDSDIWCNLEKRTDRSMVSGAIRLQISIEIKGEEKVAPYYDQYTCLHENFFHYLYDQPNSPPSYIPPGDSTDAWERYFEPQVQEIVEEFAQRYGIDKIYMAMTHFSCLATKLLNPSVPPLLSDLLAHINVHYAHSASAAGSSMSSSSSGNSSQNRFNASNFRKEKFTKLLDQLHNSIRLELIDYRNNFPASEPMRLRDLQACVDLLTSINFFRMKVQGLVSPPKASAVVEECIKANMRRTYQFLYDHCYELYQKEFEGSDENKAQPSEPEDPDRGPVLKNLDFWHKLIALIVSVIEEDRNTYGPVLNQFPSVKVGDISALILWQQLADDLEGALLEHEKSRNKCKSSEYMNLHFKIKWLYSKYVAVLPEMKNKNAEYPRWFEAFVMIWLSDNDEVSLDCVKSAYERDKRDGFPKTSEQTNFSNSVVDMFSQLTQCHDVIKKLECPDPAIKNVYMARFAKTIEKVLISYGDFIENDFINFIADQKMACILLNNMQQTRVNLEKMFELMGGKELDKNAAEVLNELQERLNAYLDRLCAMCAEGLSNQVREQVSEMAKLLHTKVKGQANQPLTQPSVVEQIHQDSDTIVQPLMEYLENCISTYADNCDKTILKRMLKELWVVTLTNLEKTIVLPPQDAKKLSLANLGADSAKDKVKDVSSLLLNKVQNKVANVNVASLIQDISRDSERSLSARQCAVISAALETIKGYFHADGQGLKMAFLEKSAQLKSLQYALSLYTHTTDMLVKTFVQSQAKQDASAASDGSGDLNIQIDLFTHPGTGEHKINVKVVACNNLRWQASARPFVSVTLVGPSLAQRKRKWDTKSKTGTLAPVFNESYQFLIGNEGEIADYEMHFSVKDYCFGSDDKIIGIAVVKMLDIANAHQGTYATWLPLAGQIRLDDTGYTILRILSQRSNDDVAKEFVKLKSERRPV